MGDESRGILVVEGRGLASSDDLFEAWYRVQISGRYKGNKGDDGPRRTTLTTVATVKGVDKHSKASLSERLRSGSNIKGEPFCRKAVGRVRPRADWIALR